MTPKRQYPEALASGFPKPPLEIDAEEGETILLDRCDPEDPSQMKGLVEMYATFDPADRAQGIPPIGRESIRTWLDAILAQGIDVVASIDEEVLGHATLVPDGDLEYELAIFVHQDHRRKGLGSGLLQILLGAAIEDGISYIWLSVERWNTIAISLYESVGFRTCDAGSFELEMSIRLASDGEDRLTGV